VLPTESHSESNAWRSVSTGWKPLFGSYDHHGFSLEAHDFPLHKDLDWAGSFHPESVELCLNLDGAGTIDCRGRRTSVEAGTALFYRLGGDALQAARQSGGRHRFITLECRRDWLLRTLAGHDESVEPLLKEGLHRTSAPSVVSVPRLLSPSAIARCEELWKPPVLPPALPLWYQARVLELVAEFFYPPPEEFFCDRQKRLARERVGKVREILEARLVEPPSLEELSKLVGVSQFYLSRIFSQETRTTIPQFLRQLRMERAASFLKAGTHNVTEAAFAVGYSSLGHFSKNFCEVMGCCPTLYPQTGQGGMSIASRRSSRVKVARGA
jgi:AraC-like DNA-binding protein